MLHSLWEIYEETVEILLCVRKLFVYSLFANSIQWIWISLWSVAEIWSAESKRGFWYCSSYIANLNRLEFKTHASINWELFSCVISFCCASLADIYTEKLTRYLSVFSLLLQRFINDALCFPSSPNIFLFLPFQQQLRLLTWLSEIADCTLRDNMLKNKCTFGYPIWPTLCEKIN